MAQGRQVLMNELYLGLVIFLLLNVLACLARIYRGPWPADRMLVSQLFGTTGVAIALLLAEAYHIPAIRTVGLIFAVLAIIATAVFTRRSGGSVGLKEPV